MDSSLLYPPSIRRFQSEWLQTKFLRGCLCLQWIPILCHGQKPLLFTARGLWALIPDSGTLGQFEIQTPCFSGVTLHSWDIPPELQPLSIELGQTFLPLHPFYWSQCGFCCKSLVIRHILSQLATQNEHSIIQFSIFIFNFMTTPPFSIVVVFRFLPKIHNICDFQVCVFVSL